MFRHLPRTLIPILVFLLLACDISAAPPATLQVQFPTATASRAVTPTAIIPLGVATSWPVDPAVQGLLDRVQSDRLMITVGTLVDMRTRHVLSRRTETVGGIDGARDWLVGQFNDIRKTYPDQPISVWTQPVPFTWHGVDVAPQNVSAVFQGTDVGAGVIVLGAHYDSISTDFTNGQVDAPGADDNGSGVAALLEIARILAPQSHRATLLFVAFAAEETGRQGSQAFVKSYLQAQEPPIAVRGMINLDTIGSEVGPNGEIDHQTIRLFSAEPNDSTSRQLARQLALIISTYLPDEVNPVLQSAEERVGRWGDHQSFSEAGYPAVRIIQGLEDPARQHSPRDTFDNVQPGYLMRTTRAALASAIILADGPTPPGDLALRALVGDPQTQVLIWTPVPGAAGYLVALRQTSSLFYDQLLTVEASPTPELRWAGFGKYATVAVATVDAAGRMGPLSPEVSIASLLRK
jgi:hypothetical protein